MQAKKEYHFRFSCVSFLVDLGEPIAVRVQKNCAASRGVFSVIFSFVGYMCSSTF